MFSKIVTAPGVIRIVGDGVGPLAIPAHEIEAIQRIVATNLATEPWPIPQIGQRVRIEFGPLRGIEGVMLLAKNEQRLVVSITLLQRAVAVEIDYSLISCQAAAVAD